MDARTAALTLFLNRVAGRSQLSDQERAAILNLPGEVTLVEPNRDLVSMGEIVDRTCLVADGLMARFGETRDGSRQISALYIPGDMPDLYSYVLPRSSWALTALTKTTTVRVLHSAIHDIVERYPAVGRAFWRDCTLDGAITAEWILNIGRRNARSRVAHLLCEMAARYERIGKLEGMSFPFPINQTHLADALGLTAIHINRTLAALRKAEIVSIGGRMVKVMDWNALRSAADFDPLYLQFDSNPVSALL
ncbi:Crp/Fnr family transcriptional regulator [Sphingomonas crusticola]|uniref:Crp/Fnr family transcriptional regulator n=1 Tax=Sphingomonas crusticola TaxID=1697973 RepID=UPI000E24ADF4|nr:Crp/Fnr family transcriptional regulator [Sphingomonas crusticola]